MPAVWLAAGIMVTCPSLFVSTLPWALLRLPKTQNTDPAARCPVSEGQERYTYQHARVELWLRWHSYCFVCVVRGSRRQDELWFCHINTKYLLHCFISSCAADRACAIVCWIVAGITRPDTAVCGGDDNSSCSRQTLSSCGTVRR